MMQTDCCAPAERRRRWCLRAMTFVFGGIFGFVYEELFYLLDLGYLVKRGVTFGPWITIYGVGALAIVMVTRRLRKRPILVFLTATAVTGVIELLAGCGFYYLFDIRLWDYNTEKWNWGNVGGFICLRSVLVFGVSALFLLYVVEPLLEKAADRLPPRTLLLTAWVPAGLFLTDIVVSLLYRSLWRGW
jgi:uncharacterized membrane protein